ncbi:MAG: ATP-binding protein, partial [Candidatus Cloacimonadaceae bacterium]|nr:ATP-binding protein [Candidatus Cloacimonadaceae bacterium]
EADEIVYYVKDRGTGFDNRYQDKLFNLFERLHNPEKYEGSGVGLAIVQRLVLKHNGRVWANGVIDKGAEFYFALPKHTGDSE